METLYERPDNLGDLSSSQCNTLFSLSEWVFLKSPQKLFIEKSLGKQFIDYYIKDIFLEEIKNIDRQNYTTDEEVDIHLSKLILKLVREFLVKLNFTDGLAFDLLESWQQSERIIFITKSSYREHFIHQFYDFLGGCLFIYKLWDSLSDIENKKRSEKQIMNEEQFLRRWFFAAMFHDIGYPAETLSDLKTHLNKDYFNKIPNYEVKKLDYETFEPDKNFAEIIYNISRIHLFSEFVSLQDANIEENNNHNEYEFSLKELGNLLVDEINQTHDHGVTGAIFFLKTALIDVREIVDDPTHGRTITNIQFNTLLDDLFVAASAIAGHNLRIHTYKSYTIDFSTRPIAALLELSDDLQEWNRRKSGFQKSRTSLSDKLNLWKVEVNNKIDELIIIYALKNLNDNPQNYEFSDVEKLFYVNLSDYYKYFFRKITIKLINISTKIETTILSAELFDHTKKEFSHKQGRYNIADKGSDVSIWLSK